MFPDAQRHMCNAAEPSVLNLNGGRRTGERQTKRKQWEYFPKTVSHRDIITGQNEILWQSKVQKYDHLFHKIVSCRINCTYSYLLMAKMCCYEYIYYIILK